ncbi:MAG: NAD(P)/FAD-dependent oxidoreductase [Gammaproteobacteria bacterium]|nr:NAD(P)/FAD-dependent oxidoreductase [Gammaproteobacteria bacterium]
MSRKYDVIVIGAGNAGLAVARQTHAAGLQTAIIETAEFGGTCPNRGCTPKKVLVAAARALDEIGRAHHHAIKVEAPVLDWARLIDREQALVAQLPAAMRRVAAERATIYEGLARFVGRNEIEVNGECLAATHIVIATGSVPRELPVPGASLVKTSDDLLTERALPGHVVFIGGGVIAMEFSHVLARAGSQVTVLEALPRLLPRVDADAVEVLKQASQALGIDFVTDVEVQGVSRAGGRYQVDYRVAGRSEALLADSVVNGAGRVPNVASLDLPAGGIAHDGTAIEVDAHLRSTSNPSVWVVGDALPSTAQLSPLATAEGSRVGAAIVNGIGDEAQRHSVAQVVHTTPALATVGLTEAQARKQYPALEVHTNDMTSWLSAKTHAETTAWAKVLVDAASDRIVGAHLVGHGGDELINLFTLAMDHDIGASSLRSTIFAYPTFSSDLRNLFQA